MANSNEKTSQVASKFYILTRNKYKGNEIKFICDYIFSRTTRIIEYVFYDFSKIKWNENLSDYNEADSNFEKKFIVITSVPSDIALVQFALKFIEKIYVVDESKLKIEAFEQIKETIFNKNYCKIVYKNDIPEEFSKQLIPYDYLTNHSMLIDNISIVERCFLKHLFTTENNFVQYVDVLSKIKRDLDYFKIPTQKYDTLLSACFNTYSNPHNKHLKLLQNTSGNEYLTYNSNYYIDKEILEKIKSYLYISDNIFAPFITKYPFCILKNPSLNEKINYDTYKNYVNDEVALTSADFSVESDIIPNSGGNETNDEQSETILLKRSKNKSLEELFKQFRGLYWANENFTQFEVTRLLLPEERIKFLYENDTLLYSIEKYCEHHKKVLKCFEEKNADELLKYGIKLSDYPNVS